MAVPGHSGPMTTTSDSSARTALLKSLPPASRVDGKIVVSVGGEMKNRFGLALEFDIPGVRHVDAGTIQSHIGAKRPCKQRMLLGRIAANKQNGRSCADLAQSRGFAGLTSERVGKCRVVGSALMIDVVSAQHRTRKFLQQIILFVRCAIGADDADCRATAIVAYFLQLCLPL